MRNDNGRQDKADKRVPQLRVLHLFLWLERMWQIGSPKPARHAPIIKQGKRVTKEIEFKREQQ
mgnify:CR=1 FL=1